MSKKYEPPIKVTRLIVGDVHGATYDIDGKNLTWVFWEEPNRVAVYEQGEAVASITNATQIIATEWRDTCSDAKKYQPKHRK